VAENDDGDSGVISIAAFATGIHPGNENGNEDHQSLTFHVELLSGDRSLFLSPDGTPSLDLDGNLNFTLARYAFGAASFSVVLADDGGSDVEGVDGQGASSAPQIFTVRVLPVNNAPSFLLLADDITFSEDAGCTRHSQPILHSRPLTLTLKLPYILDP